MTELTMQEAVEARWQLDEQYWDIMEQLNEVTRKRADMSNYIQQLIRNSLNEQ